MMVVVRHIRWWTCMGAMLLLQDVAVVYAQTTDRFAAAIHRSDRTAVTAMLRRRAALANTFVESLHTWPLHVAVTSDNVPIVKLLLRFGAAVANVDSEGRTALHRAAAAGNVRAIRLLLQSGADVDAMDTNGRTPIYDATAERKDDAVRELLSAGAHVDIAERRFGWTALFEAAGLGDTAAVGMLLSHGANARATSGMGRQSLDVALDRGYSTVAWMLLAAGADPTHASANLMTPLHSLAYGSSSRDDTALAAALMERGARIDAVTRSGETTIHLAIVHDNEVLLRWLLAHGAPVDLADTLGRTPLMKAVMFGNVRIIRQLADRGANIAAADRAGWTVLHTAIWHEQREIVEELLIRGAPINASDSAGQTPLHYAVKAPRAIVALLMAHGANLNTRDHQGRTPLSVARDVQPGTSDKEQWNMANAQDLLEAAGAEP